MKPLPATLALAGAFALGVVADRLWTGRPPSVTADGAPPGGGAVPRPGAMEAEAYAGPGGARPEGAGAAVPREERQEPGRRPDDPHGDPLERRIESATAETIAAVVADVRRAGGGENAGDGLLMHAYRRWAELDAAGAVEAALGEPDRQRREEVVHSVFRTIAEQDLGAAQAMLALVGDRELRHSAVHAMVDSALARDPASFGRFLQALPEGREFGGFFDAWARRDPQAAAGFVMATDTTTQRFEWVHGVASGWARTDPAGASDWVLGTLAGRPEQWPAARELVGAIARDDPAAAAALVTSLPQGGHRQRELVEQVASEWARQDLQGAIEWAETQPGMRKAAAVGALLEEWVRADPASAAAYVDGLPTSEWAVDAGRRVAEIWGASDYEAAAAWALGRGNGPASREALNGAIASWAQADPAAAAQFATSLGEGAGATHAVEVIGARWAEQDVDAAVGWLAGLPADLRAAGSDEVLGRLAEDFPGTAAQLYSALSEGVPPESEAAERFAHVAGHIAGRWSSTAPADAATWASDLPPDTHARHRAIEEIADNWVHVDPAGASEWISTLPPGESRDRAAGRLVDRLADSDPEAALRWAMSVSEEEHRHDLVNRVVGEWAEVEGGVRAGE